MTTLFRFARPLGLALLLTLPVAALAQTGGVGIGTTAPDASAALEVRSTSQGLLLPRLTLAQRDALTASPTAPPVPGLVIYQTDSTPGLYAYDGTAWVRLGADNLGNHTATQTLNLNAQRLLGNVGTSLGDSTAQVELNASVGTQSAALITRSNFTARKYTRTILSGYGILPDNPTASDFGIWATAYSGGGWAGFFSAGSTTGTPRRWVGICQNPGYNNTGSAIRIVDGTQGAGKVLTSDAIGYGTWRPVPAPTAAGGNFDLGPYYLVGNGGSTGLSITSAGNIGIGTSSSPGQKLEVAGQVFSSTGGFRFPDNTIQTTAATTATGADFIQNTTTQQASSSFNVSGNGTVGGTLTAANAVVTGALTGSGANLGTVVGLGVRADGGLNIGQNTTGRNIYLGYRSGQANTTGMYNLFAGAFSGAANTTGGNNVFLGYGTGNTNTTGNHNWFSGFNSGFNNTTGNQNFFGGTYSGTNNTTGSDNQFIGYYSGLVNTTGSQNLFLGSYSGQSNTTGSANTALGYNSGPDATYPNLSNATAVGANVSLTQSNTVVLGNGANVGIGTSAPAGGLHVTTGNGGVAGSTTSTANAGAVLSGAAGQPPYLELRGSSLSTSTGITPYIDFAENNTVDFTTRLRSIGGVLNVEGTGGGGGLLFRVNGSIQATNVTFTSDRRFKTNIRPLGSALAGILALRGVRYEWNALGVQHGGTAGAGQVGLIAQEVEAIYPELVSTDAQGYKAVNYAQLTPVLIEAIKELKAENDALQAQVATQAGDHADLQTLKEQLRQLQEAVAPSGQARR